MPSPTPAAQQRTPSRFIRWARSIAGKKAAAVRAHVPNVRGRKELERKLGDCCQGLLSFGSKSDQDFTRLAQGLAALNANLSRLREDNERLLSVLEDRDEVRAVAAATLLYRGSIDLVHASIGTAVSQQRRMLRIEESLLRACKVREKFHRNHLMLRLVALGIRIEAARVEAEFQGVFLNVAESIEEIDSTITEQTSAAFDRIESVIAEAREERVGLASLENDLHRRAKTSIQTIEGELGRLRAALSTCAVEAKAIDTACAQQQPLILQTVGSLQHQDIVRQRLEHVVEGFHDLSSHLATTADPIPAAEGAYIHHASEVQQAHLGAARAEISQAAEAVTVGLRALADSGYAIADRSANLEKTTASVFGGFRVAELYGGEIRQMSSIAERSQNANDRLSRLFERIEEVVQVFTRKVSSQELEVKIVALNAQLAAARLPSADALTRLAEECCQIAMKNAEDSRALIRELESGLVHLREVKADSASFLEIVRQEKAALEEGVGRVSGQLSGLSSRIQTQSQEGRRSFDRALDQARSMVEVLSFPTLIESSFSPAEAVASLLSERSQEFSDRAHLTAEASARLDSHRERYTMRKENETHSCALGQEDAAPAGSPAEGEIELFDAGSSSAERPAPAPKKPAPGAAPAGDIELF